MKRPAEAPRTKRLSTPERAFEAASTEEGFDSRSDTLRRISYSTLVPHPSCLTLHDLLIQIEAFIPSYYAAGLTHLRLSVRHHHQL